MNMSLPIFFDGLREVEQPFAFLAEQGIVDMLRAGWNKVLPVIPQLIIPIKTALNTRNHQVVCKTIAVERVSHYRRNAECRAYA